MPKTNKTYVRKVKIENCLYQIHVMNKILLFLLTKKKLRGSFFALALENRLIKKREVVNEAVKAVIIDKIQSAQKEAVSHGTCRIVYLSEYAKGA